MRTWRLVSLLSILALVLAACGSQGSSPSAEESEGPAPSGSAGASEELPGEPTAGGTLVFAGARLSASLDPALTSDGESFRVLQQIYEPLVDLAPGSTNELVGVLAESWEGEPADTEYVFHLREGVTFHDGTPFNAEAVKINFDRMQNFDETDQASAYYYGALMDGFGPDNLISSVEATDELDRDDHAPRAEPDLPLRHHADAVRRSSARRSSESTGADSSETSTLDTDVVQAGTGPFMLEDYIPDDSATLVRNDRLLGRAPGLPRSADHSTDRGPGGAPPGAPGRQHPGLSTWSTRPTTRRSRPMASRSSSASRSTPSTSASTRVARENAAAADSGVAEVYGGEESPLKDLAVRQAIAAAIDKQALIDAFYGGRGSVADDFLPPSSGWYDAVLQGVTPDVFDPDAARQLLADAGFTADNPATVHFWFPTEVTRPYMPDPAGLHEAVTQMLTDVGFNVVSHSDIWADPGYLFDAQNGYYDLHFLGWTGDYDDPSNWYGVHFGYQQGEPAAQFGCDVDGLEDALATANAELDPTARGEAWARWPG